ncbi:MAG: hypothetical protein GF311_01355 [Candidatus Lokiarchaeota archaeon]|nr:hypothetical protein [Candidatus Lokiarchaeota archaeon]
MLLSEEWSHFTDESGTFKDATDLTSRQMLIIMHHKVILEYITNTILRNKRDANAIKARINGKYNDIIEYLNNLNFYVEIDKYINQYIIEKLTSYLHRPNNINLKNFLNMFPESRKKDHGSSENWFSYISNIFVPGFTNPTII